MAKLGDQTDFSYRVNKVTKVVDGDTIEKHTIYLYVMEFYLIMKVLGEEKLLLPERLQEGFQG